MSRLHFEGQEFAFVKASIEGGVSLECWRDYNEGGRPELLMEAVWLDESRSFRVRTASAELPFGLWDAFIAEAKHWCPLPTDRRL